MTLASDVAHDPVTIPEPTGVLAERWDAPTALALSSGFALILTAVIALAARGVRKLQ